MMATIGLVLLGSVQTRTALDASSDAQRARVLSSTATATVRLVHELERELAETAALRSRGGTAGKKLVEAQQQRVDAAIARYQSARDQARKTAPDLVRVIDSADAQLAQLPTARQGATEKDSHSDQTYGAMVDGLLAVADALPGQLRDTSLANAAREVASVATQEHLAAQERDRLRGVFVKGTLADEDLADIAELRGAQNQRQAEFSRIATSQANDTYNKFLEGADVTNARGYLDRLLKPDTQAETLKTDPDAWYVAQSGVIRRLNLIGRDLSEQLDRNAAQLAQQASRRAYLTAGGTVALSLLSFLTAALLAVRTSRRLRRLRGAALAIAQRELPERISSIATGKEVVEEGSAFALTATIAQGRDEIAQVADAFDTVNQSALRLAGEQAELRGDVARMAEALARRIRTLITRQLRLLDEFEREETDPDALARLFALDHLAARLRRNGENLLVLAGGEPGRAQSNAHQLNEVVTAAASEIEEYTRIEANLPDVAISGVVVGNLVHLLAELLENATAYSPPNANVSVDGRRTVDGLVIRIHDQGIGVSESRLEEINTRLASPATLSSAATGSMGLHVVSHLAARHGIRVWLRSTGSGTTAHVEVPESALTRLDTGARQPQPALVAAGAPPALGPGHGAPAPARPGPAAPPPPQRPTPPPPPPQRPVQPPAATWFRPTAGAPGAAGAPPAWPPANRPAAPLPAGGAPSMMSPMNPPPSRPAGPPMPQRPAPAHSGPTMVLPALSGPGSNRPAAGGPSAPAAGSDSAAAWNRSAPPATGPAPSSGRTDQGLPRRARGSHLMAELHEPQHSSQETEDPLNPEVVRARLSALAEGVASAMRRSPNTEPSRRTE